MVSNKLVPACIAAVTLGIPSAPRAATFDCTKARSPSEVLICNDPQLSKMDDALGALYWRAKSHVSDPVAFKKQTNAEWRIREKTCVDRQCMIDWYQRRTAQLSAILNQPSIASSQSPAATPQPQTDNAATIATTVTTTDDSDHSVVIVLLIAGSAWLLWAMKNRKGKSTTAAPPKNDLHIRIEGHRRSAAPINRPRAARGIPTNWVSPGQSISVAGFTLPGGMLYVGSTLFCSDGTSEPAQIDPQLPVDTQPVNPEERLFGYWPRYDEISKSARKAYLIWLAGGRRDPNANIGYVFLFYYGLERRVLVDAQSDPAAAAEIPQILGEIVRLQSLYANSSFQRYSADFVDYLASKDASARMYLQNPPPSTNSRGLPLPLRIGLGQSAIDDHSVPPAWALAWVRSDANVHLPTAAKRCTSQFDAQFRQLYAQRLGEGLRLAVNRTKLKINYRAASGGLSSRTFSAAIGDLPDVTAVITPVKKLQAIVDESAASLDAYSRYIGRHADKEQSLEATLLLPHALWSESIKDAVQRIDQRVGDGMLVIEVGDIVSAFGGSASVTRERLKALVQSLQSRGIGVEPDVLAGAKIPKSEDSVVLFRLTRVEGTGIADSAAGYEALAVMLDLAITLANADGKISGREVQFLNRQVDAWSHVGVGAQRRLRARLRLGIVYPPALASLKSRIEPLPDDAKSALAKLLSALALADGKLSPAAVKHLEKVYRLLGIERTVLYNELHAASATLDGKGLTASRSPPPIAPLVTPTRSPGTAPFISGIKLDPARIAALQIETERVTAMLSRVFVDQETVTAPVVEPTEEMQSSDGNEQSTILLGLDTEHSAFLRTLLTRPSWSRAELDDIAADMELMLDGALERINEAALDTYENRIAEGDDPIEIAQDLLQSVPA